MTGGGLVVPPDVASHLRAALFAELARAGSELESACSTKELGDVQTPVERLRPVLALLNAIGWTKAHDGRDLAIDSEHRAVVVDALERDQDGWEWAAQAAIESEDGRAEARATAELIGGFLASLETH